MGMFRILLLMAFRSLRGHKIKVAIVGSLLAFGTFLLVLGTTLLENVESAMEASITGSITGQIQLVSKNAKDQLAFFGPAAASEQDLAILHDYQRIRGLVEGLPEVRDVIPMGRQFGQPILGTDLDEGLENLASAVGAGDERRTSTQVAKLRRMLANLREDHERRVALAADGAEGTRELEDLERANSEAFWRDFEADPQGGLEFLTNRIAKLGGDDANQFLPFLGTDLHRFAESFRHFEIVEGEMPPQGRRGFLINKPFYEEVMKNKAARTFDLIHEARTLDGKTIATDPKLQDLVARLSRMATKVTLQLGPDEMSSLEGKLRKIFPETEGDLDALVTALFTVDDGSFDWRYRFFYEEIAPAIQMYRVPVGGTFTIRAMTKSGYPKALNIKLWGTFRFKGLERSALASAYSLVDLSSFRELLGLMTAEKRRELDSIRGELELEHFDAERAEAALFGDASDIEVFGQEEEIDLEERLGALAAGEEVRSDTFSPDEIEKGTIVHAAVLLHHRDDTRSVVAKINQLAEREGLPFEAVAWSEVTGFVGQLVIVLRAVLYVLISIIFIVALVIINNSMVMATMDRIGEIGTMRAIGARRRFVLSLFLLETLVLGGIASAIGALAATGVLGLLGRSGIPAKGDFFIFLFGGPALYPEASLMNALLGLAVILLVSILSTLYPARLAAKVAPVVAMQRKE